METVILKVLSDGVKVLVLHGTAGACNGGRRRRVEMEFSGGASERGRKCSFSFRREGEEEEMSERHHHVLFFSTVC